MVLARRMPGRDVEGLEVVEVIFDVRAFSDREAHFAKDGDQFVDGSAKRMEVTDRLGPCRQGNVDPLLLQARVKRLFCEEMLAAFDRSRHRVLDRVQRLPSGLAAFRIQLAELLHQPGHAALLAESAHAQFFQSRQVRRLFGGSKQLRFQTVEIVHELPSGQRLERDRMRLNREGHRVDA